MKQVLPQTWTATDGGFTVGGVALTEMAERFGTPLVLIDERHVEDRLGTFRDAFPPETELTYAGKAFLCGALIGMLDREGWLVDVVSDGELELVRRAGLPMERVVMHGNAKSPAEIAMAAELGVGRFVVDHAAEVDDLADAIRARRPGRPIDVLLRLNVDLDPDTHEKVRTVGPSAHFGMEPATAAAVAKRVSRMPELRLVGVHIHAGSQIRDAALFTRVAEAAVGFVEPHRDRFSEHVELDLGGGLAVPYLETDRVPSPYEYAAALEQGLTASAAAERLGSYRLLIEPGRSVIANAGLTLYRVNVRKRLPEIGDILAVDGGFSDNPRPSLYGASYEVLNASRASGDDPRKFRIVGRHCESGDVVAPAAMLPGGTEVGDTLVVPATGAYVFAMSSRYNGVGRPAVVFVRDGVAREVLRRETHDDLLACDLVLGSATRPVRTVG